MQIPFKKLHPSARIPTQAKRYDAGYDLYALDTLTIKPFERKIVSTGIAVEIPQGYYGRVAPRSGLAVKKGIDVLAGVIDSGYRDGIGVVLINFDAWPFLLGLVQNPGETLRGVMGVPGEWVVNAGDKIAQLIIEPCAEVEFIETSELSSSERGVGGFGSSGVK